MGSLAAGVLPTTAGDAPDGTILLNLGPDHPSRAGLLELRLWTEDSVVGTAEVVVGAMHRGAEKLFEVRDYRQILMLADRHDWQAAFAGELSIALACEQALGLEVPARAVWLRTLLAEHTRILSHLGFAGYVPYALGMRVSTFELRERLREQMRALTGNRIHPMVNRLGGLAADAGDLWLTAETAVTDAARRLAGELSTMINSDAFADRSAGVAPLAAELVHSFGVSGPAARASGVDLDLRRSAPYLAYAELADLLGSPALRQAQGTGEVRGADGRARFAQLVTEILISCDLVDACVDRLRSLDGPVAVKLPKIVKVPEGETYLATEAPLGMAGVYLVSRGEKTPWRLKLRTASYNNVAALEGILPGCHVEELETALASMGYVVGDIDK